MKLNYLMPLALLATTTAFHTTAQDNVKYVFKAMDKSLNTRICVASANNDLPKLKQLSRKDQLGIRNITMNLICNNKDVTSFTAQYDAPKTTKYLNRRAPLKYKINLEDVEIIDLAYNPYEHQTVKVIYISSK